MTVRRWVIGIAVGLIAAVGAAPLAAAGDVTASPEQLRANERVCRAAVNRVERLEASIENRAPVLQRPAAIGTRVTEAAVRADRFRARTAMWRANRLAARLDGRADPRRPTAGGPVPVTVFQLRSDQRVARSALRRATALGARVPPPFSPPLDGLGDPRLTWIQAVATGARQIRITDTSGANAATVGSVLVLPYSSMYYQALHVGAPVGAAGRVLDGVFFPVVVSVEPVPPAP